MSKQHIPYFDFYPADFMHGVRGLSAQEVGVYTMMLCRIYEDNGPVEFHVKRLATYCGMREATFSKTVETLIELGKLELADGKIFNRRAESEISNRAKKLKINSKAGKVSAEKRQQNQSSYSTDVQRTFNHTDTDTDTEATLSSVADAPPQNDLDILQSKLIEAAGENGIQPHGSIIVGPIVELIATGVNLELDILPVIRSRCNGRRRPAGSWAYFVPAIREAYERRVGSSKGLEAKPLPTNQTDEWWSKKLSFARLNRIWETSTFGPMPGKAGCMVPSHLLQSDDGKGWRDTDDERKRAAA